ncbi:hypothetical protein G8759_24675 [Spirosoma aureum]|uniref:Lipoprotein n=1 Tax=Spirosoma aureum TaxID=2692134 RepID=A0A6G9ASY8_9BACT|nr:hypothetical protein [Spirosoma aureum]QIP15597.1 hypothetical protein G8759_24675 [Spirosoma aureum]
MKTNQLRSLAVVGMSWLALGVGCQKDPPKPGPEVAHSCNDGTCCMLDARYYDYVETIANEPADLSGSSLTFKNGFPSKAVSETFKAYSLGVCDLSHAKIVGLLNTVSLNAKSWEDYPFRYRVWGKVYHDRLTQTIIASPILNVYVDRIEEVK